MRHARRRAQFVAGRRLIAAGLRSYGGERAREWGLATQDGKPMLTGVGAPGISLAHCDDLVACAICERPVGIDVLAQHRTMVDDLARLICGDEEWADFLRLPPLQRVERFHSMWLLKEALYKCLDAPPSIAALHLVFDPLPRWLPPDPAVPGAALKLIELRQGWRAALAVRAAAQIRVEHHALARLDA